MIDYKDFLIREKDDSLEDDVIASWDDLERKYGIKFLLKNGTFRPVNEWLDDLYLQLTPAEIKKMLQEIMEHGEILFADLTKHQE